jgi:hypothetical protein
VSASGTTERTRGMQSAPSCRVRGRTRRGLDLLCRWSKDRFSQPLQSVNTEVLNATSHRPRTR